MPDSPVHGDGSELIRLLQAVQASGEVIFMTDRAGVFTFVNRQFERLYGHTAAEVVGCATPRLLKGGKRSPEQYAALWQRLVRGETIEDEFVNRKKDGGLLRIQATVNPIWDDRHAIVGFLAIQRDITERRLVEQALRRSQAQLQLISDNVLDLVSQIQVDGTFLYVSPSYETVLGHAPAQLVGRSAFAFVHPEDREHVQAVLAETMTHRTKGRAEFRYRHADGRYLWVEVVGKVLLDETGTPSGAILSGRDVTERKHGEETLRANEQRLELAVASADMSVFTQDRDLRFTWMYNPQLGVPSAQVIGKTDADLVPPETASQFLAIKRRAMETGERVREEISAQAKGHTCFFELLVEPQRNAAGQIEGVAGAMLDITKRRELEDQLRQSQKMEAVGSLAGGIAHDFNNLLTAILGYAEFAIGALDPASPVRKDIEEIQRAGQSAASLTKQLLIFSRKDIVQPVLLHISDVVARLDKILRRVVGEDIEFTVRLGAREGSVKADAGQLEQVVMNLVVNARDAMPSGGALTIETDRVQVETAFARSHGVTSGGTFGRLTVTDTGSGITPEVQSQIFTPFFTTKGPEKGTGLGLATVHGIVHEAGGFITVTSTPGKGSTFAIYLPLVAEAADTVNEGPGAVSTGVETILFVEDDETIRTLAVRALREKGYTVLGARHAAEALTLAAQLHGKIDLLVTDLVMPGMNGRALAESLKESRRDLKTLYSSGYTSDSVSLRDIRTSDVDLVQKPYTMAVLAQKIRSVLDRPSA